MINNSIQITPKLLVLLNTKIIKLSKTKSLYTANF